MLEDVGLEIVLRASSMVKSFFRLVDLLKFTKRCIVSLSPKRYYVCMFRYSRTGHRLAGIPCFLKHPLQFLNKNPPVLGNFKL